MISTQYKVTVTHGNIKDIKKNYVRKIYVTRRRITIQNNSLKYFFAFTPSTTDSIILNRYDDGLLLLVWFALNLKSTECVKVVSTLHFTSKQCGENTRNQDIF